MRRVALGVAVLLALAGCARRPLATAQAHYVVGEGYQLGGVWSYPREQFRYDATGLAVRLPVRTGLTADGELASPDAMEGAHRTLQLPAIVTVTNLDSGRRVRIRLNDRGPAQPGRLLGLSRQAADLLGAPAEGAIPVRVQLDSDASQMLRDRLGGGPHGITAAPLGVVTAEALPSPGHAARVAASPPAATPAEPRIEPLPALPAMVSQGAPQPGKLWLYAGQFSQARYANSLKNKLFGLPVTIRREARSRTETYVVQAGPFASVAAADAALDQVRAAGVTDATVVVE